MGATIEIVTEHKDECLQIPQMALETDSDWSNFVTKIVNWEKIKTSVTVWISDGNMVEIVEWLNEWDEIAEINFEYNSLPEENYWDYGMF